MAPRMVLAVRAKEGNMAIGAFELISDASRLAARKSDGMHALNLSRPGRST